MSAGIDRRVAWNVTSLTALFVLNACRDTTRPIVEPDADADADADAYVDIILATQACVFDLEGSVPEARMNLCNLSVAGDTLELNSENGWRFNGSTEIELLGTRCEASLADPRLEILLTCPCDTLSDS